MLISGCSRLHSLPFFRTCTFASVRDGKWYWGLGDPDAGAVAVTALYLFTAATCFFAARRFRLVPTASVEAGEARGSWFWGCLGLILVFLGVNKQSDFQSLVTLYGRDLLRQADLYEERRLIQFAFVFGVAAAAMFGVMLGVWLARRSSWPLRTAAMGACIQAAFIVIRAASFHHVDRLLGWRLANLKINLLLESIGLAVILIAAMFCWAQRRAAVT